MAGYGYSECFMGTGVALHTWLMLAGVGYVAYKQGWHRNLQNMNPMTLLFLVSMTLTVVSFMLRLKPPMIFVCTLRQANTLSSMLNGGRRRGGYRGYGGMYGGYPPRGMGMGGYGRYGRRW